MMTIEDLFNNILETFKSIDLSNYWQTVLEWNLKQRPLLKHYC